MLIVKRGLATVKHSQQHGWVRIAAIAIGCALVFALVLMLAPHDHAAADFVAILPLLFVGIISPLSLLAPLAFSYAGRVPQAPALVPSFQRPPPSRRG